MTATEARRRSDQARSRQTRERILHAAVDCLIDGGYAATTIGTIQARAGVSRGALLHHYPSKARLLVDAIRHLSDRQVGELTDSAASGSPADDWLAPLWSSFATPLFNALLELWIAARTDDELRRALLTHQRELHRQLRAIALSHCDNQPPANFDTVFEMTLTYFRGLALTAVLSASRRDQMLTDWHQTVTALLRT